MAGQFFLIQPYLDEKEIEKRRFKDIKLNVTSFFIVVKHLF